MIQAIVNIFSKCFLILMAALVINQSIDEIEFQPLVINGNIENFNDLNSAVEYISEIVLGHKDIFPEYQKNGSHKQSSSYKHIYTKTFNVYEAFVVPFQQNVEMNFSFPLDEKYTFLFSKEIIQPPSCV
jgi:hypothetical protein